MTLNNISGAEAVIKALVENGVEIIFGYPGGAVLPLYDALFENKKIKHILVRHEQAAVHAAEGYARSTGKVGCVLVTSGPGATNAITGLTDALMDSVPIICLSGQVPTHLIGTDAFQEADTTGISRPCTKHNYLVKDADIDLDTLKYDYELLDKEGNNITIERLNTMIKKQAYQQQPLIYLPIFLDTTGLLYPDQNTGYLMVKS